MIGLLTAIIVIIPSFLIFSIIIWKDILYSAFLLFLRLTLQNLSVKRCLG